MSSGVEVSDTVRRLTLQSVVDLSSISGASDISNRRRRAAALLDVTGAEWRTSRCGGATKLNCVLRLGGSDSAVVDGGQ